MVYKGSDQQPASAPSPTGPAKDSANGRGKNKSGNQPGARQEEMTEHGGGVNRQEQGGEYQADATAYCDQNQGGFEGGQGLDGAGSGHGGQGRAIGQNDGGFSNGGWEGRGGDGGGWGGGRGGYVPGGHGQDGGFLGGGGGGGGGGYGGRGGNGGSGGGALPFMKPHGQAGTFGGGNGGAGGLAGQPGQNGADGSCTIV